MSANRPTDAQARAKVRKVSGPSETRDQIGALAGMSGRTVEKIAAVVEAAEREPEKFADLVEEMDRTGKFCRAVAAETAGMIPGSWRMLDSVARRMGLSFADAEKVANDCVSRGWAELEMHSVRLADKGRAVAPRVGKSRRL